jgi:hypothetical protein
MKYLMAVEFLMASKAANRSCIFDTAIAGQHCCTPK